MNFRITVLLLCLLISFQQTSGFETIRFSKGEIFIGGKKNNRQVYLQTGKDTTKITKFELWEDIDNIQLSKDESLLLIHHKTNKSKSFSISVMEMRKKKILSSIKPGFGGKFLWTNANKIVHLWKCGSECSLFRIYTPNLKQVAEVFSDCQEEFIEADLVVSTPCRQGCDGIFKIFSLVDGSLIIEKGYAEKYGEYYCDDYKLENNELNVVLKKEGDEKFLINEKIIIPKINP
jgi:hypothetical protein